MAINNHGFTGTKDVYDLDDIETRLAALESAAGVVSFDKVFPVGSIFMTVDSTFNPGTHFGGTWERYAKGKTIVGVNESDTSFNSVNKEGGNKTISYTPGGSVGNHKLTVAEIPSHAHTIGNHTHDVNHNVPTINDKGIYYNYHADTGVNKILVLHPDDTIIVNPEYGKFGTIGVGSGEDRSRSTLVTDVPKGETGTTSVGGNGNHNHGFSGSTTNLNVLQPYITCYIWRRTR